MKLILRENLIIRDSRILFYAGGEIWCTELDSLSTHTDIVKNKFLKDIETIRKPSSPSFIAINLYETLINEEVAELIVNELSNLERNLNKVAFIGLNFKDKRKFKTAFKKLLICPFNYNFFLEWEDAKKWLIIAENQ